VRKKGGTKRKKQIDEAQRITLKLCRPDQAKKQGRR